MPTYKSYNKYYGAKVPTIQGAKGGTGGVTKNTLFSTDLLFVTVALGEGPVYKINPNGPQDIELNEGSIQSLLNLDTDGSVNTEEFYIDSTTGTLTQDKLPYFGDRIVTPQSFASAVAINRGDKGVPESKIDKQETSASDWDIIDLVFTVNQLFKTNVKGKVKGYKIVLKLELFPALNDPNPNTAIQTIERTISGKTDTPYKINIPFETIPADKKSTNGYRFSVSRLSRDTDKKYKVDISINGWKEIKLEEQAYPRTAIIGYGFSFFY